MTHCAIDLASDMASLSGQEEVESIIVSILETCMNIVGLPEPNRDHPENIVDAQFSIHYQVATAWIYSSGAGWAVYDKLHDWKVRELSDQITAVTDGKETKLEVKYANGTSKSISLHRPLGVLGNLFSKDRVDQKFFSLASPIFGDESAIQIRDLVDNLENASVF